MICHHTIFTDLLSRHISIILLANQIPYLFNAYRSIGPRLPLRSGPDATPCNVSEGFAISAMKHREETQIRRDRGYGETGFIHPNSLSCNMKPRT